MDESDDVTVQLNLDTSDPTVLRDLFKAYGLNFIVRSQQNAASLFSALGAEFRGMLTPASGFHFICGPADQRCIVQVLDLGDESIVAAVCTGEGEISNQSMAWVTEQIVKPIELVAKATGGRWGIVSSGHYDAEDAHLANRIPLARVVPVATLEADGGGSKGSKAPQFEAEERGSLAVLLKEVRGRFLAYARGGRVEPWLVLADEAESAAKELWRAAGLTHPEGSFPHVPIGVVETIAWFHWSRYYARPVGEDRNDLQVATIMFAHIFEIDPKLVPDELHEILTAKNEFTMEDNTGIPAWYGESYVLRSYPSSLKILVQTPEEQAPQTK